MIQDHSGLEASTEFDNKIEVDRDVSLFDAYDSANFNSIYRRKKYSECFVFYVISLCKTSIHYYCMLKILVEQLYCCVL